MHAQNRGGAVSDCSASNGDFAHAVGRSGTITPRIDLGYRIGTERGRRCNPTIQRASADKVSTLHRVVLQKKNPRPFGEGNPLSRHRRWHVGQSGASLTAMSVTPSETPRRLAGLAQFARAAFGLVLDTALPPLCAACRQPVGGSGGLCASCWSKVSFIAPPYCERLGIPFAYDPGPGSLSMEAIADPPRL